MSKDKKIELAEKVMSQIKNEHIKLKPKWYFYLGSLAMIVGLISAVLLSIFLINLTVFSFRTHGPMKEIRYNQIMSNFPLWAPILAIAGIWIGIIMLKKYDFSYQKNFLYIIIGVILAIILAGWLINYLEIDNSWNKRGPMRKFYQQYRGDFEPRGPHWRLNQKNMRNIN